MSAVHEIVRWIDRGQIEERHCSCGHVAQGLKGFRDHADEMKRQRDILVATFLGPQMAAKFRRQDRADLAWLLALAAAVAAAGWWVVS